MMRSTICLLALCAASVACGGAGDESADGPGDGYAVDAVDRTAAASSPASSFQATMSGAIERTLEGDALAGAKYNRYHINIASRAQQGAEGAQPVVVIAFGRTDTRAPAPGTYALGGRDGFRGTVEQYGSPQREFDITSGELVITGAQGDVLTGSFTFTAVERAEEFGSPTAEVGVEGTFRTRPAD